MDELDGLDRLDDADDCRDQLIAASLKRTNQATGTFSKPYLHLMPVGRQF
jgi:hypothetical protein